MLQISSIDALNDHQLVLKEAADKAGIRTRVLPPERSPDNDGFNAALCLETASAVFYQYKQVLRWANADGSFGEPINGHAHFVAKDKHLTKSLLHAAGIPTPRGELFRSDDIASALLYAAECSGELCVKPNRGGNGDLVCPQLQTAEQIRDACLAVASAYDEFLIEESVSGEVWRFFYVQPDIVGVKVGVPASVEGDGRKTIAALIEDRNAERERRRLPGHMVKVEPGYVLDFMLQKQGMTIDVVPSAGQRVFLDPASNGARGSDALALVDRLHPEYKDWMRRAFEAVPGLLVSAADVMIPDPQAPPTKDNFHVIELNGGPGYLPFRYPLAGPVQDVCGAIIALLQRLSSSPESSPVRLS